MFPLGVGIGLHINEHLASEWVDCVSAVRTTLGVVNISKVQWSSC